MNPNEQFGKLHPWQLDIVKLLTEGFDEPAQPMYLPLPSSKSTEQVRERFIEAAVKHSGKEATVVWIDQLRGHGLDLEALSLDGITIIDGMACLLEWKNEVNKPMPVRSTMEELQDALHKMCDSLVTNLYAEKPHISMNDWRNNRGGRKHR